MLTLNAPIGRKFAKAGKYVVTPHHGFIGKCWAVWDGARCVHEDSKRGCIAWAKANQEVSAHGVEWSRPDFDPARVSRC